QISQVVGQGISASGSTSGSWYTPPLSPLYDAHSMAIFDFQLTNTAHYQLDAWLVPGTVGTGSVELRHIASNLSECVLTNGELHLQALLGPGDYEILGTSLLRSSLENADGATYTYLITFSP